MPASNYHQSDFCGGEWGQISQGRSETPNYRTALNVAINLIPLEEGSATRRSGTEWLGPTHGRTTAKLLAFQSSAALPYVMEFTNDNLQFYAGTGYVCTNDERTITSSSSSAAPIKSSTDMSVLRRCACSVSEPLMRPALMGLSRPLSTTKCLPSHPTFHAGVRGAVGASD